MFILVRNAKKIQNDVWLEYWDSNCLLYLNDILIHFIKSMISLYK